MREATINGNINVLLREFDDDKCYEITDNDFDSNGKFIGTIDDNRKSIII